MTETLTRPNGKTYRPRGRLRVVSIDDPFDDTARVIVLGTHDSERALPLALQEWRSCGYDEPMDSNGAPTWLREVPWDDSGQADYSLLDDPERGRAALIFEAM